MKKKNLVILLLIPFIIALVGMVTVNVTINIIEADILSIDWDYSDQEAFKISNQKYPLSAKGVDSSKYPVADGNNLVWKITNKDSNDSEVHAEIVFENNGYYLHAISVGEIIVTCSNQKGNIFRSMNAIIYENGAILLNSKIPGSQNNIDPTIYYGEYDLVNNIKQKTTIEFNIDVVPLEMKDMLIVKDQTDNIESIDLFTGIVRLKDVNENQKASFTIGFESDEVALPATYDFEIVNNGINVYTYDDLLECTNKSASGEIVVLRKSFESVENTYQTNGNGDLILMDKSLVKKANNIELFGKYNHNTDSYSFKSNNEVYYFKTKYNAEFISQWNQFASQNKNYSKITDEVIAGLRVQKDFYGNGYTINFHNLTYPYDEIIVNQDNVEVIVPSLRSDNLFKGPLPFYTLGDPNNMPLITAYGQDNIGLYVEGNNILINDVNVKNCDFGNSLANLEYTGTVLELDGNDITVKNSRFSNGKNVVRSFSSNNIVLNNCMLSNSRNFLLVSGSNEYIKIDDNKMYDFTLLDGTTINMSIKDYFVKNQKNSYADGIITQFLLNGSTALDVNATKKSLNSIQSALNESSLINGVYKGSMTINDCLFYQSGIASIALETLFNGPYLYNNVSSMFGDLFAKISYEDRPLIPLEPTNISGLSYPVKINVTGNTNFYDYKDVSNMDLTGLINENISAIANSLGQDVRLITIDDIFPLKPILKSKATANSLYKSSYINIPVAFYGGGLNLSTITFENNNYNNILVDLLDEYLSYPAGSNSLQEMKYMLTKTVTTVIGFEPFEFICFKNDGYLFDETPSVSTLILNAKGA